MEETEAAVASQNQVWVLTELSANRVLAQCVDAAGSVATGVLSLPR